AAGQRPHGEDVQPRLFAAVQVVLDALSAEAPVLLVLEDLHWADSSTLDLVTYRNDEAGPDQPLQRLTTGLLRARTASAVDLGPLTEGEVTALLDGIAKGPVAADLIGTIFQR